MTPAHRALVKHLARLAVLAYRRKREIEKVQPRPAKIARCNKYFKGGKLVREG